LGLGAPNHNVYDAAAQLLDQAWRGIVSDFSDGVSKPVVFVVGAGVGAPRTLALRNVDGIALKKVRCFYDTSHLSLNLMNNLIEECHENNQPTIALYVTQPLPVSAKAFITLAINANLIPSATEFALSHFNCLNTFILLTKRHRKNSPLFASSVISYEGAHIRHETNPRLSAPSNSTLQSYESDFIFTWRTSQVASSGNRGAAPLIKIKPLHAPKKTRTLNQTATFVSHIVALTLRANCQKRLSERSRSTPTGHRSSATPPAEAPAHSQNHTRTFGSQETIERATAWREVTAPGQKELLEDERPQQIVVREKVTQPHEMETVIIHR
jgi:hypothetical protein